MSFIVKFKTYYLRKSMFSIQSIVDNKAVKAHFHKKKKVKWKQKQKLEKRFLFITVENMVIWIGEKERRIRKRKSMLHSSMSCDARKPVFRVSDNPTMSDTYRPVQPQKKARSLKIQI